MRIVYFPILALIAVFESQVLHSNSGVLHDYFAEPIPEDDDDPDVLDPKTDDPNGDISLVKFDDLVKRLPK